MAETADFVSGGAGFDKLLVFVDLLTRWVEATPFNGPPSTEDVLDAFITQIVSRHGVPRQLRSDAGSNFASALAADIFARTGTDLTNSEAEHHESVGIVERVQQTLTQMTRATNEGGGHWADHLPFILMSYRATVH